MSASGTPHIKFPAILAQRCLAAVAIDNGVILSADLACDFFFHGNHFKRLMPFIDELSCFPHLKDFIPNLKCESTFISETFRKSR
jgi:hypothetical protein